MPISYKFSKEQIEELQAAKKKNKNKNVDRSLKNIKSEVENRFRELTHESSSNVRLLFEDEAGFGRINKPKYCWCKKGMRPSVYFGM